MDLRGPLAIQITPYEKQHRGKLLVGGKTGNGSVLQARGQQGSQGSPTDIAETMEL